MRAVLDACVLYPTVLREILVGAADAGLIEPRLRAAMGMLLAVHGALLLPVLLSLLVRNELSVPRLTLCALSSSVSFFLITNLAHWLFMRSSHSLSTLLAKYVDAIPFFRSTLWGDLTRTALRFGSVMRRRGLNT